MLRIIIQLNYTENFNNSTEFLLNYPNDCHDKRLDI